MRGNSPFVRVFPQRKVSIGIIKEKDVDKLMQMNEITWSCGVPMADWHIAAARALGAINRAPTRCGAWVDPRPQARRGTIHGTQSTSRSDVPTRWLSEHS